VVGFADRLDTLQAAVLNVKLRTLAAGNERRRELAAAFNAKLAGVGDLVLPPETPHRRSVYHLYVVRTRHRDALLQHLRDRRIGAAIHYPVALHLQPAYAFLGHQRGEFPNAEAWADECLSLPMYPELTTEAQDRIVSEIASFFAGVA
jgi:dTDP-4-amino-4,6-dideoxygalactose transaminase